MPLRLLAKWRLWLEPLAGIDDPQGDYLLRLESRVRRLEGEVAGLRERLSTDAAMPTELDCAISNGFGGVSASAVVIRWPGDR